MGERKQDERFNLDLNLPVQEEAFTGLGFQDSERDSCFEFGKRRKSSVAHSEQHSDICEKSTQFDKDSSDRQSPFDLAMEVINNRNLNQSHLSLLPKSQSLMSWVPAENRKRARSVPMLMDLSLNVLAANSDKIAFLRCVPYDLRHKLSKMVSDSRQMDARFVQLLARDSPAEIRIWDASQLTEDDCTKFFRACDTNRLEVLQLDFCGQCMTDYVLRDILAGPLCSFDKLVNISLKGAIRFSDTGLSALAKSAPSLQTINLSQCPLLTADGIEDLASHLGSTLRELRIDDCQNINAMLILPALKKFKHLEMLSMVGIRTVNDDFIIGLVEACGINIKELVLADCVDLTDRALEFVSKFCPKLCVLDLSRLHNLTDSTLQYLANGCRSIHKLNLSCNNFCDEAIAAFLEASGRSLNELSLNNISKVHLNTALSIAKCLRSLLSLDLSWCRKLTDEAVGLIVDSCSSLKLLKVFGCTQITEMVLKGHSNSEVSIIGCKLTPFLEPLN